MPFRSVVEYAEVLLVIGWGCSGLDVFFWGKACPSVDALSQESLRADQCLWQGFMDEALNLEGSDLVIGQQHFKLSGAKEFNVNAASYPSRF